jgi:hypothetical protein
VKRHAFRTTLAAALVAGAAGPLLAQVPVPNNPPPSAPPAQQPFAPPPKMKFFQVTGAMTIPVFSYADYLDDIGWAAQATFVLRRGPFNHIRIEGEYNSAAYESAAEGGAELYGGGIGGGRVVVKGNVQSEGYGVIGLYQHDVSTCAGLVCADVGELQFGLKVGGNIVMGSGRVHPVLDIHWLSTFSQPYANLIVIGGGLRF